MTRDFSIAITGHRPNRLPAACRDDVAAQIGVLLDQMAAAAKTHARRPVLISALAEGADRMAAQAALARGIALVSVLPFAADEYARDFQDDASQAQFRQLMALSERVVQLPGDGQRRNAAYEAVGLAALEMADILIAVWDGQPAAGRGGTAQIVAHAAKCGLPVVVVDAAAGIAPHALPGSAAEAITLAMRR